MYRALCHYLFGVAMPVFGLTNTLSAATISGYVRERGSQESMPYVSLYLEELRI